MKDQTNERTNAKDSVTYSVKYLQENPKLPIGWQLGRKELNSYGIWIEDVSVSERRKERKQKVA